MLKVKCIQKFRAKNNIIIGYRIMDQNGNTKDVSSKSLKQVIQQGRLEVVNLTLTSDNRLIDKTITQTPTQTLTQTPTQTLTQTPTQTLTQTPTQTLTQQTQKIIKQSPQKLIDINSLLLRLKPLGRVTEIDEGCDHKIYLIKMSEEDYRLIIPDDVTEIKFNISDYYNYNYDRDYGEPTPIDRIPIRSPNAKLTVYGGNNLKIVKSLFAETRFRIIDLREFSTSKVTDMSSMFYRCKATSLDLSNLDTSKVTCMRYMFNGCEATSLDLSNFDTSNVTDMSGMFKECKATSLDLSKFNTSNVTDMTDMFKKCQATSLDLSSFDTSKVEYMGFMFNGCYVAYLDLSNFDTRNVMNMEQIFYGCEAGFVCCGKNKDLKSEWDWR